jgi:hypothetical protein
VNAPDTIRVLNAERSRDATTPIASRRHELVISKTFHQHCPGVGRPLHVPTSRLRPTAEPETRQGWRHDMKSGVIGRTGVRKRIHDFERLDHGARPTMCEDERHSVRPGGLDVEIMNV